jgi:hypothetical protein
MAKKREIDQEKFEKLLNWLSPDMELAGNKYESIRLRLIKFFTLRGASSPDELADVAIDIVTEKIDSILGTYEGDPALYFHGVGKNILLKYKNVAQLELPPHLTYQNGSEEDYISERHGCLENCLQKLKTDDRELITAYYQESKSEKIKLRKSLADKKGVSARNLRVYVHRLKEILEKCIRQCIGND